MKVEEMRQQAASVPDIRAGAHSAKGLREENQDAMTRFQSRFGEVIVVADGMGGHQGGATASDMVVKRFAYYLESFAEQTAPLSEALQQAAMRVNDEIYERGHSGDPSVAGMGSTLVVAVIRAGPAGREAVVANAGDSRAYLVRDGALRQLTRDHTAAQRMVEAGMLTPEGARSHPNASVLTRALGQQLGTTVETYPPVTLQPGDGLLLCSDGLSGYVTDDVIARSIGGAADPNNVVRNLIEVALNSGSDDNITVQFLRFGDRPPLVRMPAPAPAPVKNPRWLIPAAIVAGLLVAAPAGWYAWRKFGPKPAPVKVHDGKTNHDTKGSTDGGKTGSGKTNGNKTDGAKSANHSPQQSGPVHPAAPSTPPHESSGEPAVPPPAAPASSGGEGAGPAAAPPQAGDKPAHKNNKKVEVRMPHASAELPSWIEELKRRVSALRVVALESGDFKPAADVIRVWYRKDAEKEFERDILPLFKSAEHRVEAHLPSGVDVLIVMPNKS